MPAHVTEVHYERARVALRRGADPGEPIPSCACFQNGLMSMVKSRCVGVCEEAVSHVALAIAEAEGGKAAAESGKSVAHTSPKIP